MPGSPPTGDSWEIFFDGGVLESWLELGYTERTRTVVRDWLWSFQGGPPADAGLVFGMARSKYYDPEYRSARIDTDEGLIEARFVTLVSLVPDAGNVRRHRLVFSYVGPLPPIDAAHPGR